MLLALRSMMSYSASVMTGWHSTVQVTMHHDFVFDCLMFNRHNTPFKTRNYKRPLWSLVGLHITTRLSIDNTGCTITKEFYPSHVVVFLFRYIVAVDVAVLGVSVFQFTKTTKVLNVCLNRGNTDSLYHYPKVRYIYSSACGLLCGDNDVRVDQVLVRIIFTITIDYLVWYSSPK